MIFVKQEENTMKKGVLLLSLFCIVMALFSSCGGEEPAAQTGSEERNQYLSEERANIVKRMFVENYEIAEDRIVTKAYGASEQVYGENDWNRVTIIELK